MRSRLIGIAFGTALSAVLLIGLSAFAEGPIVGKNSVIYWNPNTESDLAGYKLYLGVSSGVYSSVRDVGLTQSPSSPEVSVLASFPGITDGQYYVVVTAYDLAGNESGYSAEAPFFLNAVAPANPVGVGVRNK